jgi:hypothetical protein
LSLSWFYLKKKQITILIWERFKFLVSIGKMSSGELNASLAFQILLFLYVMLFLLLNYFLNNASYTMKVYYIVTLVLVPLFSVLAIGLTAAAL